MEKSTRKAVRTFIGLSLVAAAVVVALNMGDDDEVRVAKFNGHATITQAGYELDNGGVAIAPCRAALSRPECGPNDKYIVGFATILNGKRREGYVTINEDTLAAGTVTFWPEKKE